MPQPACIQHWRLEKHFLCDGQLDKRADLSRRVLDTNGPSACLQVQHAISHALDGLYAIRFGWYSLTANLILTLTATFLVLVGQMVVQS